MQHRLTHYFIGLYLTLCSLGQVQATTDPFEELVKTTTQRLNAQIKQNALNERRNQAHLNRYILYLGGKDWKNNNTDTSWVRDDTDETILESQLKALDRQAKEGMFAQPYKDAGFHMVYIGDYTIHLNSLVSVEDLASLRTLDKLKDPKKVEAQHLARVNQNILSTITKIKEGIEWTSFNRTNKMLYIYLRIRFVYSDSNYKTIAYRQLTGERSLGGKAQAYISEATRGNMYDLPIVYLKNKVPKLRDAIKEVMDGRAEIKEETPILASFDMNWNTSTSTSIDAQLLSGVGTVDEMTSQHAQNAQIEFMDYTGHYQANSAEQKNLRLFLNFDQQEPLAAYRLAKKIIIRVTNQNTPKEIRHAIAQFELPANAVLIWLDFDASKQSFNTRIRYGEGLRSQYLADQNAADRYLQAYFEAVMVKAIDANEWVNGKNAMRFLAFLTDNLGYIIKQTQLPEAAWNPEKSPCLLALPEDIRLRWALIAGIYNGAIQELSGVPDLVGLIAKYFYDPQVYTQINGMLAELSISGLVQSMGKAAVAHAALYKDPNIYKVHHQAGKDIFGIVSFLAPILKAGKVKSLADLRLVLLRMVDFRPSAQWLLQVAKKSALTLKQEGQKLLIYADRQATRLLASIENGMIRLEQTLDELSGGRLLGSFDEAQVITPDGRTITTKVELWEKDNKVYMKGDGKGSVGGLDWGSLLNAKALQKLKSLQLDEQAEKLLFADLKDAKLRKAMNDEPELLEGWKELNNVDQVSRVDIQTLKSFGMLRTDRNYFDFFKSLDHSKKTWNNKMNAFEESVIKYWTTKGGFAEFNRILMSGIELSTFFKEYKESLLRALSKLDDYILPPNSSLHRGIVMNTADFNSKYFVGNEFPEAFFTSTSKFSETAESFMLRRMDQTFGEIESGVSVPVLFRIKSKIGKDITQGSLAREGEILFRPGKRRKVVNVKEISFDSDLIQDIHGVNFRDLIDDLPPSKRKFKIVTLEIID